MACVAFYVLTELIDDCNVQDEYDEKRLVKIALKRGHRTGTWYSCAARCTRT